MKRFLVPLIACIVSAATMAPAAATIIRRGTGCPLPDLEDTERADEVFVGELYEVVERVDNRRALSHWRFGTPVLQYRFSLGVVTRYRGKQKGVVEIPVTFARIPTLREGSRFLVLGDTGPDGLLQLNPCGLVPVEKVPELLASLAPRGRDLQSQLRKVRKIRAAELADAKRSQALRQGWMKRAEARRAQMEEEIRQAISDRDTTLAYETWMHREELAEAVRLEVLAGREPTEPTDPMNLLGLRKKKPESPLKGEVTSFLLAEAARARGEFDYRQARKLWRQALQVDGTVASARAGLEALEAEAAALFQAAYQRRSTDPALARAGLRDVLRMTSGDHPLHQRALRLLAELK